MWVPSFVTCDDNTPPVRDEFIAPLMTVSLATGAAAASGGGGSSGGGGGSSGGGGGSGLAPMSTNVTGPNANEITLDGTLTNVQDVTQGINVVVSVTETDPGKTRDPDNLSKVISCGPYEDINTADNTNTTFLSGTDPTQAPEPMFVDDTVNTSTNIGVVGELGGVDTYQPGQTLADGTILTAQPGDQEYDDRGILRLDHVYMKTGTDGNGNDILRDLLNEPDGFRSYTTANGMLTGWRAYYQGSQPGTLSAVGHRNVTVHFLADRSPTEESPDGIYQYRLIMEYRWREVRPDLFGPNGTLWPNRPSQSAIYYFWLFPAQTEVDLPIQLSWLAPSYNAASLVANFDFRYDVYTKSGTTLTWSSDYGVGRLAAGVITATLHTYDANTTTPTLNLVDGVEGGGNNLANTANSTGSSWIELQGILDNNGDLPSTGWCLEFYMKKDIKPSGQPRNYDGSITIANYTGTGGWAPLISIEETFQSGKLAAWWGDGTGAVHNAVQHSSHGISFGSEWNHWVVVCIADATGSFKLYKNGQPGLDVNPSNTSQMWPPPSTGFGDVRIGRTPWNDIVGEHTRYVRFYTGVLTDPEIQTLYDQRDDYIPGTYGTTQTPVAPTDTTQTDPGYPEWNYDFRYGTSSTDSVTGLKTWSLVSPTSSGSARTSSAKLRPVTTPPTWDETNGELQGDSDNWTELNQHRFTDSFTIEGLFKQSSGSWGQIWGAFTTRTLADGTVRDQPTGDSSGGTGGYAGDNIFTLESWGPNNQDMVMQAQGPADPTVSYRRSYTQNQEFPYDTYVHCVWVVKRLAAGLGAANNGDQVWVNGAQVTQLGADNGYQGTPTVAAWNWPNDVERTMFFGRTQWWDLTSESIKFFRVWDKVLTQSEVNYLYNEVSGTPQYRAFHQFADTDDVAAQNSTTPLVAPSLSVFLPPTYGAAAMGAWGANFDFRSASGPNTYGGNPTMRNGNDGSSGPAKFTKLPTTKPDGSAVDAANFHADGLVLSEYTAANLYPTWFEIGSGGFSVELLLEFDTNQNTFQTASSPGGITPQWNTTAGMREKHGAGIFSMWNGDALMGQYYGSDAENATNYFTIDLAQDDTDIVGAWHVRWSKGTQNNQGSGFGQTGDTDVEGTTRKFGNTPDTAEMRLTARAGEPANNKYQRHIVVTVNSDFDELRGYVDYHGGTGTVPNTNPPQARGASYGRQAFTMTNTPTNHLRHSGHGNRTHTDLGQQPGGVRDYVRLGRSPYMDAANVNVKCLRWYPRALTDDEVHYLYTNRDVTWGAAAVSSLAIDIRPYLSSVPGTEWGTLLTHTPSATYTPSFELESVTYKHVPAGGSNSVTTTVSALHLEDLNSEKSLTINYDYTSIDTTYTPTITFVENSKTPQLFTMTADVNWTSYGTTAVLSISVYDSNSTGDDARRETYTLRLELPTSADSFTPASVKLYHQPPPYTGPFVVLHEYGFDELNGELVATKQESYYNHGNSPPLRWFVVETRSGQKVHNVSGVLAYKEGTSDTTWDTDHNVEFRFPDAWATTAGYTITFEIELPNATDQPRRQFHVVLNMAGAPNPSGHDLETRLHKLEYKFSPNGTPIDVLSTTPVTTTDNSGFEQSVWNVQLPAGVLPFDVNGEVNPFGSNNQRPYPWPHPNLVYQFKDVGGGTHSQLDTLSTRSWGAPIMANNTQVTTLVNKTVQVQSRLGYFQNTHYVSWTIQQGAVRDAASTFANNVHFWTTIEITWYGIGNQFQDENFNAEVKRATYTINWYCRPWHDYIMPISASLTTPNATLLNTILDGHTHSLTNSASLDTGTLFAAHDGGNAAFATTTDDYGTTIKYCRLKHEAFTTQASGFATQAPKVHLFTASDPFPTTKHVWLEYDYNAATLTFNRIVVNNSEVQRASVSVPFPTHAPAFNSGLRWFRIIWCVNKNSTTAHNDIVHISYKHHQSNNRHATTVSLQPGSLTETGSVDSWDGGGRQYTVLGGAYGGQRITLHPAGTAYSSSVPMGTPNWTFRSGVSSNPMQFNTNGFTIEMKVRLTLTRENTATRIPEFLGYVSGYEYDYWMSHLDVAEFRYYNEPLSEPQCAEIARAHDASDGVF